jgi:DNA-binding CsgD family transcriptional regulator
MLFKRAAHLEKLNHASSVWDGTVDVLRTAGFEHVIYHSVDASFGTQILCCTMERLYDGVQPCEDPFLVYACDSYDIIPIGTEFVNAHPYITAAERAFIDRAGERGFTAGMAIPTRLQGSERFGGFILGTGLDRATFAARFMPRAEEIRLFCLLIHRRIEELSEPESPDATPEFRTRLIAPKLPDAFDSLSPREREVVYLVAHGRSRSETAEVCGISIHTVSDYTKSAYRKLGVHNRAQAAALMMEDTEG